MVYVSGNWTNYKLRVSWRMYIYKFSCNILYLISLSVYFDRFYHSNTEIGNLHTSFYCLIWNINSVSIPTANWVSLLLNCLRYIKDGWVCYIRWMSTYFVTNENLGNCCKYFSYGQKESARQLVTFMQSVSNRSLE